MATIRLVPSAYSLSSTTRLSISNPTNMYTNTDSETYAVVTNSRTKNTTSYYTYIKGFNFSDVPSSATVNSFTVKIKFSQTNGSTTANYRPYLVNNTTTITGTGGNNPTSGVVTTLTFTGVTADWDTIKGYGSNFGIRINCRCNSTSTTTTPMFNIYGAEILVDYTDLTEYEITSSAVNGTISPSGTFSVSEGDSQEFTASANDGYVFSSMTVNGVSVTPTETEVHGLENGKALFHFNGSTNDDLGLSTYTSDGSYLTTDSKKFGTGAIYFDGSSYCTITLPEDYSPITIEMWFNVTADNTSDEYPTLFSTNAYGSAGGTYMHIDDGSYSTYPVCRCNANTSSSNTGGYGSTVITRNTWHHFAYCRNGSSHYYFVDGVLQYTVTQDSPNTAQYIYIGGLRGASSMQSSCYMTGYVDELLVSNTCKWTSSFTPPTSEYSTETKTVYTYTISNITEDKVVVITFNQSGVTKKIYIKANGSWGKYYTEAYKKINGTWVKQTDLSNVFDSGTNYVKG